MVESNWLDYTKGHYMILPGPLPGPLPEPLLVPFVVPGRGSDIRRHRTVGPARRRVGRMRGGAYR